MVFLIILWVRVDLLNAFGYRFMTYREIDFYFYITCSRTPDPDVVLQRIDAGTVI